MSAKVSVAATRAAASGFSRHERRARTQVRRRRPGARRAGDPADADARRRKCGRRARKRARRRAAGARAGGARPRRSRHRLTIQEAIPAHAGLGSGTQLALAVSAALRRLEDLPHDPAADAALMARGARSGLGAGLFQLGRRRGRRRTRRRRRRRRRSSRAPNFPTQWRVLLVCDPDAVGLHGADERDAFAELPPFERGDERRALPAGADADRCRRSPKRELAPFGAAVTRIQEVVGDHFAPAQGGRRFTSAKVEAIVGAAPRRRRDRRRPDVLGSDRLRLRRERRGGAAPARAPRRAGARKTGSTSRSIEGSTAARRSTRSTRRSRRARSPRVPRPTRAAFLWPASRDDPCAHRPRSDCRPRPPAPPWRRRRRRAAANSSGGCSTRPDFAPRRRRRRISCATRGPSSMEYRAFDPTPQKTPSANRRPTCAPWAPNSKRRRPKTGARRRASPDPTRRRNPPAKRRVRL